MISSVRYSGLYRIGALKMTSSSQGPDALERLRAAINRHDLEAVVGCFAENYRNETPIHPVRGFRGREQVRANWTQILRSVPDLSATVLRSCSDEDSVWAEWDWTGTGADGAALHLAGVTVLGVVDDLITWSRFYLEPVDAAIQTVDAAVRATVGAS